MTYEIWIKPCRNHAKEGETESIIATTEKKEIASEYVHECREDCPKCKFKLARRYEC